MGHEHSKRRPQVRGLWVAHREERRRADGTGLVVSGLQGHWSRYATTRVEMEADAEEMIGRAGGRKQLMSGSSASCVAPYLRTSCRCIRMQTHVMTSVAYSYPHVSCYPILHSRSPSPLTDFASRSGLRAFLDDLELSDRVCVLLRRHDALFPCKGILIVSCRDEEILGQFLSSQAIIAPGPGTCSSAASRIAMLVVETMSAHNEILQSHDGRLERFLCPWHHLLIVLDYPFLLYQPVLPPTPLHEPARSLGLTAFLMSAPSASSSRIFCNFARAWSASSLYDFSSLNSLHVSFTCQWRMLSSSPFDDAGLELELTGGAADVRHCAWGAVEV